MRYDYNLLKRLYEVHSPSRGEKPMRKLLKKLCKQYGADVEKDKKGNLLVTKGKAKTYPCICAHMDQVQHAHSEDFTVLRVGDVIMGYSPKSMAQQGLGADDKNGLWIALSLLRERRVLKCAFFMGEEVGCIGSSAVDMEFFKDCRFCIQPDRRNGGDLITNIGGKLCSDAFLEALDGKLYGYLPTDGLSTDVGTLAQRGVGISCVNISCGYYHPHTDHECTKWGELCNALDFARHVCRLRGTYRHEFKPDYVRFGYSHDADWWGCLPKTNYGYGYGYGSGYGYGTQRYGGVSAKPAASVKTTKPAVVSIADKLDAAARKNAEEEQVRESLRLILGDEPHLTFEEVCNDYYVGDAVDVDILRSIYKDVKEEISNSYFCGAAAV